MASRMEWAFEEGQNRHFCLTFIDTQVKYFKTTYFFHCRIRISISYQIGRCLLRDRRRIAVVARVDYCDVGNNLPLNWLIPRSFHAFWNNPCMIFQSREKHFYSRFLA